MGAYVRAEEWRLNVKKNTHSADLQRQSLVNYYDYIMGGGMQWRQFR